MIVRALDIQDQIRKLHKEGMKPGLMLGLPSIDRHYSVRAGNTTIITAYPTSGKTYFMLNILCCLTVKYGLRHFLYTPEMGSASEINALVIEILTGGRFDKRSRNYLSEQALEDMLPFVHEYFHIYETETSPTMQEVCGYVTSTSGLSTFTIDNYNDLSHSDAKMIDLYTEQQIVMFNGTAKKTKMHGFLMAHPRNIAPGETPKVPRPDEIKGGSAWWSKGQTILGLNREENELEVKVWKVKPRVVGERGEFTLHVDIERSTYAEKVATSIQYLFQQAGFQP